MTQDIPKDTWRTHFDELSRTVGTAEVTIEVAGQDIGDQIAAEQRVLTGITYDDKDDVVVVGVGSPETYEHIISGPERIGVAALASGETAYDVTDREGRQHLIRLRPAEALPPAG